MRGSTQGKAQVTWLGRPRPRARRKAQGSAPDGPTERVSVGSRVCALLLHASTHVAVT